MAEPRLRCTTCGAEFPIGPLFHGCPACTDGGTLSALEVVYDYDAIGDEGHSALAKGGSFWDYAPLMPIPPGAKHPSLGEGNTPIISSCRIGPSVGLKHLYFKNETVNPTWSFKDRYNAVTIGVAGALGFRRVVNSSTGNHGASVAAYAAATGMDCIIVCPPQVSTVLQLQIGLYGAQVVVTDWDGRAALMEHLVRQHGWFPVGLFMPFVVSNPYGVEGYKTFAYEINRQLQGVPDHIFFPSGRGNGLYGCWKGWTELHWYGLTEAMPAHHAVQPEGANPLVRSFQQRLTTSVVVPDPHSVATSTREAVGSDRALAAIYASGGTAVSVSDAEIMAAVRALGGEGLCVEPASAMSVAAVIKLAQAGQLDPEARVVCVLTAGGIKWPCDMKTAKPRPAVTVEPEPAELDRQLVGWGWV